MGSWFDFNILWPLLAFYLDILPVWSRFIWTFCWFGHVLSEHFAGLLTFYLNILLVCSRFIWTFCWFAHVLSEHFAGLLAFYLNILLVCSRFRSTFTDVDSTAVLALSSMAKVRNEINHKISLSKNVAPSFPTSPTPRQAASLWREGIRPEHAAQPNRNYNAICRIKCIISAKLK